MFRHLFARMAVVQEGRKPLPHCDRCGMHMPLGQLLKHQQTKWCERNMQMWWRRKGVAIAIQCEGVKFSLTVEDNADFIEGIETFKYLGVILYQSRYDFPAVLRKVEKACRVWNRLRKIIRREGADPRVSAIFGPDSPPLWGGDMGFVRGNIQKSGGGTRRFPKADNGAEGVVTGGRDLGAGGSREVP